MLHACRERLLTEAGNDRTNFDTNTQYAELINFLPPSFTIRHAPLTVRQTSDRWDPPRTETPQTAVASVRFGRAKRLRLTRSTHKHTYSNQQECANISRSTCGSHELPQRVVGSRLLRMKLLPRSSRKVNLVDQSISRVHLPLCSPSPPILLLPLVSCGQGQRMGTHRAVALCKSTVTVPSPCPFASASRRCPPRMGLCRPGCLLAPGSGQETAPLFPSPRGE